MTPWPMWARAVVFVLGFLLAWAGDRSHFEADRWLCYLAALFCLGTVLADVVLWWPC